MPDERTLTVNGEHIPVLELTGILERARGCIGMRSPPEHPVVWDYKNSGHRSLHMVGVPFELRAAFVRDGRVVADEHLRQWIGVAAARADLVVEYPPDRYDVAEGDSVSLTDSPPRRSASEPLNV